MNLLNAKQAAEYLGIGKYLFDIALKRGEIKFKIVGKTKRFPVLELDKWLKDTQRLTDFTPINTAYIKPISLSSPITGSVCSLDRLVEQKTEERRRNRLLQKLKSSTGAQKQKAAI